MSRKADRPTDAEFTVVKGPDPVSPPREWRGLIPPDWSDWSLWIKTGYALTMAAFLGGLWLFARWAKPLLAHFLGNIFS